MDEMDVKEMPTEALIKQLDEDVHDAWDQCECGSKSDWHYETLPPCTVCIWNELHKRLKEENHG